MKVIILAVIALGLTVFSKTTASNITVLYPNGGESLEAGKTYKIQWSGSMTSLKLSNGYALVSHDEYNADPAGSYIWRVPLTTAPSLYSLEAVGCCGTSSGVDASDAYFSIIAPQNLYSYFRVSPSNISQNQPVTLSWEINSGVQASLKIECPTKSITFLNNQRQKIYNCGDVINDLPLVTNFDLRPQDYWSSVDVNFVLSVLEIGGRESIYGNQSLTVSFQPAQLISGYTNYGQYVKPVEKQKQSAYIFKKDLEYGMENDADIIALQTILKSLNLFNSPVTSNYYSKTKKAVQAFQKKYGIKQTGVVGPKTRAQLNHI
mgnify:CR=1 FL=1